MEVPAAKIYFPDEDKNELAIKIKDILSTGMLTLGKYNKEFEENFSSYTGTKYAVAVNSGTSALEIVLRCLNIQGSSVIVPTNTFVATPASVIHAGGNLIFADIKENLFLDPEDFKEKIRSDTKAVIVVHIGGYIPPEIDEIKEICEDKNISLIEDAAHAHGSTYNDQKAGSFGIGAGFSFYPTKVMTSGEGGMITTNDKNLHERALVFRDQGKAGFIGNVHTELGYNWRMSEIHAVIGLSQFARLEEFINTRIKMAKIYDSELEKINVKKLEISTKSKSNYYKYVAFLDETEDREEIKKRLREEYNVGLSGEVYELPCHLQPIFKKQFGFKGGEFPISEDLCERQICLPLFPTMDKEQAEYVVNSLGEVLK